MISNKYNIYWSHALQKILITRYKWVYVYLKIINFLDKYHILIKNFTFITTKGKLFKTFWTFKWVLNKNKFNLVEKNVIQDS